jgi:signal transduction histidine kinase
MTTQTHFLTSISHELKNQIVPIFSLSEMIKDQCFGKIDDIKNKQEYLEAAQDIYSAAQDMLELLNDLMDISCGNNEECEDFSVRLEEVDVADLIKRSIRINKDLALRKNIQIVFNNVVDQEKMASTPIKLDPRRIKQILINLLSNSIKYSPNNTKIIINLNINTSNNLTISIQDQGIGMTKEQIKMALQGEGARIDKSALMKNQDHHYQAQKDHHKTQHHNQTQQDHHKTQTTNQTQQDHHKTQTTNQTQHPQQTHSHIQTQPQYHNQTHIDSHGIGMPLVKRLVELQNGTMEVLSEIGNGTKILLCFMCNWCENES